MKIDISSILKIPSIYRLFISLIGGDVRFIYAKEYIRQKNGDRVLDIGCGPGDILKYLCGVEYVGFDKNRRHIEAAKKRYGDRGTFLCKEVNKELTQEFSAFDIVLAMGILHHLDDNSATQLLELSKEVLRPSGRLVTFDGCYTKEQSWIDRFVISVDRGHYVRTKSQYLALASGVFTEIKVTIRNDLIRVPYTHIIMECTA